MKGTLELEWIHRIATNWSNATRLLCPKKNHGLGQNVFLYLMEISREGCSKDLLSIHTPSSWRKEEGDLKGKGLHSASQQLLQVLSRN